MIFVYLWLACGLLGFCITLLLIWFDGHDLNTKDLVEYLFGFALTGPMGLSIVLVIGCLSFMSATPIANKVIIKGRKK